MNKPLVAVVALGAAVALTGCSNKDMMKQKDARIGDLESQVTELNQKVSSLQGDLDEQKKMNDDLKNSLSDLQRQNKVLLDEKNGLTHITLDGSANFGPAQAWLTKDARNTLDRVWDVLKDYPDRRILVEGHTDNQPIASTYRDHFASNWELSTARANEVLHYLVGKHNAPADRLAAVGYGPSEPVASNATAAGRAQNRRVVITVGSKVDIEQRISQN